MTLVGISDRFRPRRLHLLSTMQPQVPILLAERFASPPSVARASADEPCVPDGLQALQGVNYSGAEKKAFGPHAARSQASSIVLSSILPAPEFIRHRSF